MNTPPISSGAHASSVLNLRTSPSSSGLPGLTAARSEPRLAETSDAKRPSTYKRFKNFFTRAFSRNKASSNHPVSSSSPALPSKSKTFTIPRDPNHYYIRGYEPGSLAENMFALRAEMFLNARIWTPGGLLPIPRPASPKTQTAEVSSRNRSARPPLSYNFKTFAALYGTNEGAQAINAFSRYEISPRRFERAVEAALKEMSKNNEKEYLSLIKERRQIKAEMYALPGMLPGIVKEIHARAKQPEAASEIFRGQGMSPEGIDTLRNLCKKRIPVEVGNFVSCSTKPGVAQHFSDNYSVGSAVPYGTETASRVIFHILAYSQSALASPAGYGESEVVLPPNTQFQVACVEPEEMYGKETGRTVVMLREISPKAHAVPMPR